MKHFETTNPAGLLLRNSKASTNSKPLGKKQSARGVTIAGSFKSLHMLHMTFDRRHLVTLQESTDVASAYSAVCSSCIGHVKMWRMWRWMSQSHAICFPDVSTKLCDFVPRLEVLRMSGRIAILLHIFSSVLMWRQLFHTCFMPIIIRSCPFCTAFV